MMLYFGYIMAYNDTFLEKAGAGVPTTYAEMIDIAKKTTGDWDGDGIVDHWGLAHQTASPGGAGTGYLNGMLHYMLDAGSHWTDADGKLVADSPAVAEGLRRWKEVIQLGLTPPDLTSGQARQLFADGKVAFQFEGPWIYPIMETATPEVRPHLKLAMVPFSPPVGGSSNVLAMPTDISPEKKELVWEFIKLSMSPKFQSLFASLGASPPPSPTADVSGAYEATPHFDLLVQAQKAAAAAHVERTARGLEAQWNEFAKMAMEETIRMIVDDLDPAAVGKTIQEKGLAIQQQ
jgi:multiple sugar transport system substrate-binding protein